MTIVEFLTARLDEDFSLTHRGDAECPCGDDPEAPRRADCPARWASDIAAKRAIVDWCGARDRIWVGTIASDPELPKSSEFVPGRLTNPEGSMVLRLLASVYADHPDYREDWKP